MAQCFALVRRLCMVPRLYERELCKPFYYNFRFFRFCNEKSPVFHYISGIFRKNAQKTVFRSRFFITDPAFSEKTLKPNGDRRPSALLQNRFLLKTPDFRVISIKILLIFTENASFSGEFSKKSVGSGFIFTENAKKSEKTVKVYITPASWPASSPQAHTRRTHGAAWVAGSFAGIADIARIARITSFS